MYQRVRLCANLLWFDLDQETYEALERQAKQTRKTCAKVAEDLLSEGLARRELAERTS